jgi:hypothetical protein
MKAEVVQYPGRAPRKNPRFVVTNLAHAPEAVYAIYRQRGDVENRHKELKDRSSATPPRPTCRPRRRACAFTSDHLVGLVLLALPRSSCVAMHPLSRRETFPFDPFRRPLSQTQESTHRHGDRVVPTSSWVWEPRDHGRHLSAPYVYGVPRQPGAGDGRIGLTFHRIPRLTRGGTEWSETF